jgi:hypothetical protein
MRTDQGMEYGLARAPLFELSRVKIHIWPEDSFCDSRSLAPQIFSIISHCFNKAKLA